MSFESIITLASGILSIIVGMIAFIARGLFARLLEVEKKMQHMMTEPKVRQLLTDRYDMVLEDIRDQQHEIKEKVNQLFELYVQTIQNQNRDK